MASLNNYKIIQQAKNEYEAAKAKGDKAGMVRAHAKADRARGQYTKTVLVNGQYQQQAIGSMGEKAASGELLADTRKLNQQPPSQAKPQNFRNAPAQISITPEQQEKNQQIALQELKGPQGNLASFVRGAALSVIDPFGVRNLNPNWRNSEQDQASAQNTFNTQLIKNPRAVAQGFRPVETIKSKAKYETLGEVAGSVVGVDPVAIAGERLVRFALGKAGKAAGKIPVLVNGKTKFVDAPTPTQITRNTPAPAPRIVPRRPAQSSAPQPDIYLHATDKEFDKFKPAGDGLIYFSKKQDGVKTKADAIYSSPANNRMIEANIDESKTKHFDPFADPEAKAIAEKYGLPVDRSYIKWDEVSPMSLEAIKSGYSSFDILEPSGGYSRAIANPEAITIKNNIYKQPETPTTSPQITPQPRKGNLGVVASQKQANPQNVDFQKGGLKSVGADTFKGEKTIDQLVDEYGAIPKGEAPRAREVDIPKKTDYGDTQQYARTLQESAIVDDALYKDINDAITQGSFTKPMIGNKTVVDDANTVITNEGIDNAMNRFKSVIMSDKKPTSYDIALGNRVLQELQKSGRYDDALNVAIDLSDILSESGRTLQAARIAKRLSPEGRLMIVSRVADKVKKKTGNDIQISDDILRDISNATTEKEIVEANQKAAKQIWDQVPANWIDKINSWRYMAMLFNPKTHVRNIVGNTIFVPVREFKNLLGAGIEKALIREGERTKAVLNPFKDKALIQFANNDFENVKALLKNEGKIDDSVRSLDAKVFNTRLLEGIRKFNLGALDAEDTWFMQAAYDSSLAQYMKANKLVPDKMVGDTLEKARAYATNEALKATYRDFNSLANLISRGKAAAASGKSGPLGRIGGIVLEGAIPFSKTPLNIIKRGVGYSPANIVRGVVNLGRVKSGKVTATEAIDQLASGLSGSALLGLGTWLGYNKIVTGKEGGYKDKLYNYNQMLGSQNYSLNIDGKSYTLDWAAPLSMPFFVGVELAKAIKDNNADLGAALDAMMQISDPMVNLSMLKGISDIIDTSMAEGFEGIGKIGLNIATGYLGQYVPTLGGQIARTVDDTRRSTISTADSMMGREVEKFGRKQLGKIPLASKNLEPYVDLWGREQRTEGLGRRIAENFLSPGYYKEENVTPVDRELKSLLSAMDEETAKEILPSSVAYQYSIEADSQKYQMTEAESTQYQKDRGQETYKNLERLFNSGEYQGMDESGKIKAIRGVYTDAGATAKMEFLRNRGMSPLLAMSQAKRDKYAQISQLGVDEEQFIKTDSATKGIEGIKDDSGKTIELSGSYLKKKAIDKANPGASPAELMALYYSFGVSKKVWGFN
jgi:hypothetical protein